MNAAMEPLRQQVTEKEDLLQAALAAKADWNETEEKFNLQVFLCLILLLGPCRGRGANHLEHVFARARHSSRCQDKGKKPTGQGEGSKDRQLQKRCKMFGLNRKNPLFKIYRIAFCSIELLAEYLKEMLEELEKAKAAAKEAEKQVSEMRTLRDVIRCSSYQLS